MLYLNISLKTPRDQRSATVIYSSSTRRNKNTTSEREVMILFFLVKTITEIYLLSNGIGRPFKPKKYGNFSCSEERQYFFIINSTWLYHGINKLNHVITSCSHTQVHDYFMCQANIQESDEKSLAMRF